MLDLVRKHAKSWLIKVALFLIVIVFIFWGGYSYKTRQEGQMAKVGDYYVSINQYNNYYNQLIEMYKQQMRGSFSEDLVRQMNLKKQALTMLIDRQLIYRAAQGLGLTVTSQEIQQKLLEFPVFQTEGKFDKKRYEFILRQNRLSPETFEQQMGEDLTVQKVEAFVKRRAMVTEAEIEAEFRLNNTLIQAAYLLFDPKILETEVKVDDTALEAFYQQRQDRYKDPEKRQLLYVLFDPSSYLPDVKVTENQIKDYYEDHRTDYNKEQEVRAQHILFSVKEDAPEAEVAKARAEAEKVLSEAKGGKDFSELAKQYSQDPTVGDNGGDLGFFTRGRMVPAFAEAAFSLKPGEIGELVRTPYGFHIIRVAEVRPAKSTSLDEARAEIESNLKGEITRDIAHRKARDFADMAYAQKDIGKAAQAMKAPLTATGAWVSQKDALSEVGGAATQSMNKLFALPEKSISDVFEVPKGFLVVQVDAIQPPQVIPFDKAKERVEKEYRTEQARALAQKRASEVLEKARELKSLEQAGRQSNLEVKKSDWFSRSEPDKDLPALQGEARIKLFELEESRPFPEAPLMLANRYAVIQLLGRKVPEGALDKERPEITKRLLEEKQGILWQTWLDDERGKTQIEIYKEP
jgi:peptidyl-prolyl cis-trans isomerase D